MRILAFYPELERGGPVRIIPVFDRLSEDLRPADWLVLGEHVVRAFREGATGVVIAHGTDTLGYTAAALSFLLVDLPGPRRARRRPAIPRPALLRWTLQPPGSGPGRTRRSDR